MLAGVAPIPASSGQTQRMRLNRGGNRQLNRALYVIALARPGITHRRGHSLRASEQQGKTWREALRALKRHLARVVFHLLVKGARPAQIAA